MYELSGIAHLHETFCERSSAVLRILDVYPGSRVVDLYPSRIPDPKTATKDRSEKHFVFIPFFVAANFKN